MMKSLHFLLLIIIFSISVTNAQVIDSDSSGIEIEILTIEDLLAMGIDVASFKEQTIFNTPSTVSVIDKETIKRYNFTTISEALNTVAGFSVMRTYLKRNIPTARGILQDHYANKVLVMINNVPSWHGGTGEGNLDRIDIADVERIEVLKGPASVLYGTNAYSGAINIVLKKTKAVKLSAGLKMGENGLIGSGANMVYESDNYSLFVGANSTKERGYDYTFIDQDDVAGHVNEYVNSSNFTFSTTFSNHSVLFNAYQVDESYLGVSPKISAGAGKNHLLNGLLFNYTFSTPLSEGLNLKLLATYDRNRRDLSRTFDDNTRANIDGEKISGQASLIYSPNEDLSLQLGTEYGLKKSIAYENYNVQLDEVTADNNMKDRSVYDWAIFGQANYTISSLSLLLGVRYNENEFFGGNVSTRGTLVYELDNKNSIKLVYGTSYRAPSLFELYFKTSTNTVLGNINLEPEESSSIELSYLTSFSNLFIQALVYHASYTNKIYRTRGDFTVPDGTLYQNVSYYTNGQEFTATGIEVELKYQLSPDFDSFVNYCFIDGDNGDEVDGSDHYNFKYVPQHTITAGLSKGFGPMNVSALINYLSERGAPENDLDGQVTLDLNVGFKHKVVYLNVRHNISVKNLFDELVLFPEYVGRALNSVPSGYGRQILYSINVDL